MAGNKRKLEDLSMEEFMAGEYDSSSSESEKLESVTKKADTDANSKRCKKGPKVKKSLKERLREHDPEFFEFLQKEDKSLLEMNEDLSDDDDEVDSSNDENSDDKEDDKFEDEDDDIDYPESSDEEMEISQKKSKAETKEKKKAKVDKQSELLENKKKKLTTGKTDSQTKKKTKDKKKNLKLTKKGDKLVKEENVNMEGTGSDDDDDIDYDDIDEDSDPDERKGLHKPPETLEVMTDSEDDEDELGRKSAKTKVTMKMIQKWTMRFKEMPTQGLIHEAVHAFRAAVQQTAAETVATKYKVVGSKVFNAVIRMCLVEIPPALHKILDIPDTTDLQKPVVLTSRDLKWKKIRVEMKLYLRDILQLISNLSQANMIDILLKHILRLVVFYACFPKLTKAMLKKVIGIWSTGEETSRVLAFLCVNRMIRLKQDTMHEPCLKQMYMAFVKNCKFTSPNALPLISFMQRTLVEVLSLDFALGYQYAFIYIRQLAIHLRNAIATKKKESCQAVYNWQFIHSLGLWVRFLGATHPNEMLEPLIYPLTQTIIGTIKLVPTQKYYPLRFHCVRYLTTLSQSTGTFIPVLPFLLEILEQTDFNKKHKSISFRPLSFLCVLKLSKNQILERSFKDGVIDQMYELLLEHFNIHAHTIAFPELALPAVLQLKEFLKKCKVGNFTKQIKQIVEKVEENCKFITNRRRTASISLSDTKAIEAWERQCQDAGTPLGKFYNTWKKLRDREIMHKLADKEKVVGKDRLPQIDRSKGPPKATAEDRKEFSALFDTDSEEEDIDMTERFLPDKKLRKNKKKGKKPTEEESDGDYSDFDSDELEQLAGSGDDDDDDDEGDAPDDNSMEADEEENSDGSSVENDADESKDDGAGDNDSDENDLEEEKDIIEDFNLSSDED